MARLKMRGNLRPFICSVLFAACSSSAHADAVNDGSQDTWSFGAAYSDAGADNSAKWTATEKKAKAFLAGKPKPVRAEFDKLLKVFWVFAKNQNDIFLFRVDTTGQLCQVAAEQNKVIVQMQFSSVFDALTSKEFKKIDADAYKKADTKLNEAYQKFKARKYSPSDLFRQEAKSGKKIAFQDALKITQRNWILYRDAWVSFFRILNPTDAELEGKILDLQRFLTDQRIEDLPADDADVANVC